ncbi:hypothetical protein LSH36_1g03001 [Paralvinella palmiformis]|uniref:START domain-containing protein n=1 Tax=Paralvinella palmiformis TaxID=53620 RepID=A0AAD9NHV6_9ANNE|nr:hypothetical protein LSH36_1g03001 [Paralvinella palmiformis]
MFEANIIGYRMDSTPYIWVWVTFAAASLTALWLFLKHDKKARATNLSCNAILKIIQQAKNVLSALTDIAIYPDWRVSVGGVTQISPTWSKSAAPVDSSSENKANNTADATGVQYDEIRVDKTEDNNAVNVLEYLRYVLMSRRKVTTRTSHSISRCWNKEDNGCCWLLEMTCHHDDWTFYLVQPVEKWFDAADSSETNSTTTPTSKAKAFFNDVMTKLSKDDGKPDSMFVKRLKNLIEEKKEWYEERKRRAASKGSKMNKPKCQELDSSFDNGHIQTDQSDSDEADAPRSHREVASRPKHAIFGTKTMAPDESGGERADDAAPSTLGRLIRRRLWADRSGKSTESDCQNDEVATSADPERQQQSCQYNLDQINQGTENTLEAVYNEVGEETIAAILSVKSKISNIDIQLPYEQQAQRTGGWIYCGLERDVVILRRIYEDGASMQSFLGKGLIACSPKQVFETLRNPRTRFAYDDMLKKMETLQEFENGMKILYWYYEVSQMFKKVSRDFCILQYEHVDGSKYVISLRSIKWPGCIENDDIRRATLHASGWIIEPAPKDNKLYSMVTYIMQYLIPSTSIARPLSSKDNSPSRMKTDTSRGDTLSVLAAQYTNIPENFDETTSLCSRNMPCQWSFCPWNKYLIINPKDKMCTTIANAACRCPSLSSCNLKDADVTPLTIGGVSFVKLEYSCQVPNKMKVFGAIGTKYH